MSKRPLGRQPPNLLRSGAIYALATVAPVIVSLLITPLVTRALGAEGYGVVGISITLYQMASIVLGMGLSASITRHAIIGRSGVEGAVALVFGGAAISLVVGVVVAALLPLWGPLLLDGANPAALLWPVVSGVSLSVLTLCQSVYRAIDKVKTFVALGILSAVAGPGIGYVIVLAVGPSPASYLLGLAVGHTASAVAALTLLPRVTWAAFSFAELRTNLSIGLPTVPHSVASALLVSSLVVFASVTAGVEAAGRLQLALFLGTAPLIILGAFNNAWAPMVYRASDAERTALLTRTTRAVSVLVLVLTGGFAVLAEPVARFIAGPSIFTTDLLDAALVASSATAFMAMYLTNMHLVFLSGRTRPLAFTTPLSLLGALATVTLLLAAGWDGLPAFAIGIPTFHIAQSLISANLARRTGYDPPSLLGAMPTLTLAVAAPIAIIWAHPPLPVAIIAFIVVAAVVAIANRDVLRGRLSPG